MFDSYLLGGKEKEKEKRKTSLKYRAKGKLASCFISFSSLSRLISRCWGKGGKKEKEKEKKKNTKKPR